jgi:hypothetical protein
MAKVFQELFRPNAENAHIYIQKINDLSRHYKKIAVMLRNMNEKLAGGALYSAERPQLSDEDKRMFLQLKTIKNRIK